MDRLILEKYERWLSSAKDDKDLLKELESIKGNEKKIEDAFFKDLSFGTGGLRGEIGAGTNRINIYTVRKASQGFANHVSKQFKGKDKAVAISYDSRIKSDLFAKTTAEVFAANGIKVHIYKELMPTPCLSFAVRELHCAAGVNITASHNPSKYNGYKAYNDDGCQITTAAVENITNEIALIDPFKDVKHIDFDEGLKTGMITYISDDVFDKFIERVKKESVVGKQEINRDAKIIYSPLNGTGLKPVTRILKEAGFDKVFVVKEQEKPDGTFKTCPYPNPEIKEAMQLGVEYAKRENADLLIATDPDCDRVGIAVKDCEEYTLLSGNETGLLLFDYVCNLRTLNKTMPESPYAVKTIVTSNMAEEIAKHYGVKLYNVLTGFKYIGELILRKEQTEKDDQYIFGFEESYGYLSGGYVRDKDAVNASLLIAEMFAYYKTRNISLIDKLKELYSKYGFYLNKLDNYVFEGAAGFKKMNQIMLSFREEMLEIAGYKVVKTIDYSTGVDGLPKSDVIEFFLDNGSTVIIRPSGTEPKLKMYSSIKAINKDESEKIYEKIRGFLNKKFE